MQVCPSHPLNPLRKNNLSFTKKIITLKFFDAIQSKDIDQLNETIKVGVDINQLDVEGKTAWHNLLLMNIDKRSIDMTNVLIKNYANPNIQSPITGRTPLHLLMQTNNPILILTTLEILNSPKLNNQFEDCQPDFQIKDSNKKTPLDYIDKSIFTEVDLKHFNRTIDHINLNHHVYGTFNQLEAMLLFNMNSFNQSYNTLNETPHLNSALSKLLDQFDISVERPNFWKLTENADEIKLIEFVKDSKKFNHDELLLLDQPFTFYIPGNPIEKLNNNEINDNKQKIIHDVFDNQLMQTQVKNKLSIEKPVETEKKTTEQPKNPIDDLNLSKANNDLQKNSPFMPNHN